MFLRPDEIKELHVETTNLCNAACPMCDRNVFGCGDRPGRGLASWTADDAKLVFDLPNLERVFFCGTHGDPLATKDIVKILRHAKTKNLAIDIFTNGSLRSLDTWKQILNILDDKDSITFGIDGLETNHLYRQNTNIDVILERVRLAAKSTVKVYWDFLVFKHNEYEIEECKELAKVLGIQRFRIRRTPRFDKLRPFPVFDQNGEVLYYLEPPTNEEYKHPNIVGEADIANNTGHAIGDLVDIVNQQTEFIIQKTPVDNSVDITCDYRNAKKMYVNSRLEVFPCCYISDTYETYKRLTELELKYPIDYLNLKAFTWDRILSEKYFERLVKSWTSHDIIPRCIKTCGSIRREAEQNLKIKL